MKQSIKNQLILSADVEHALTQEQPLVALESTVITHGLPFPQNLELARNMEATVRDNGANPATIALIKGQVRVGITSEELSYLAQKSDVHKISVRDISAAMVNGWDGGTTVASTSLIAQESGLQVFATGGIGGVHREPPYDISADLPCLAHIPIIVVCAGAKAILDLPATLEYLETHSVPVVGYQTDQFPAFYSRSSGLPVSVRADNPDQVAHIARKHWGLGLSSAVLVVAPPPKEVALDPETIEAVIKQAIQEGKLAGIRGQFLTPYLLNKVSDATMGASLHANLGLLLNNARIASQIAVALALQKAIEV